MILKKVAKNSEFTYGVHSGKLAELVPDNTATILSGADSERILKELDGAMMGSVRALNNELELLRQGIAYGLPFSRNAEGEVVFLTYCREKINTEAQLSMKLSLAPGGHIERYDLGYYGVVSETSVELSEPTAVIDHTTTVRNNLTREFLEEVELLREEKIGSLSSLELALSTINDHSYPCGFVMDSKPGEKYVGNIHFGALFLIPIPQNTGFKMKEEVNKEVGWLTIDQLKQTLTGDLVPYKEGADFEPWSRMVIEKIDEVVEIIDTVWGKR